MTINSFNNRVTAAGDGTTVVFAFAFPIVVNTDLVVQVQAADGTITTKSLGPDYSVSSPPYTAGGSVTMAVAPAIGSTLIIYRDVPITQSVDLQDGGPLPAATVNRALDRITMWGQRLKEQIIALSAVATQTMAGLMSAADKVKLDGIQAGAQVNVVTSVAGKTGAVTLVKGDVGLGNVDNTSDVNKPVSTAQAAADTATLNSAKSYADTQDAANLVTAKAYTDSKATKAAIGLGNVDNTSDANKPVSTAQQAALDAKLTRASNLSDLTNVATARTNLGGGATGISVFQAATSSTALTAIGATAIGSSLVTAANAGAARSILGLVPGTDVQAYSARLAEIASIAWAQGDILYFNGTSLVRLPAGTAGQFFRTGGPSGTPDWASIAGGGDMLRANNLSDVLNPATARANIGAGTGNGDMLRANNLSDVTNVATARTNLGGTSVGVQLFTAADASAARTAIGAGTGSGNGSVTSVGISMPSQFSVSGSPVSSSGTLAITWGTGSIPVANGGTGQTSYTVGDILYADTTSTLAKLADVAGGNVLRSGGVGIAPSWGKVGLTTHVSGTLPVANGGTGATAYATTNEYQSATVNKPLEPGNVWASAAYVSLTDGATIAVDMGTGFNFTVTLGGNRTLGFPTNLKVGQRGTIEVVQDGTGSRTLSYASGYKWQAATAGILSTAAGAVDEIYYNVRSASEVRLSLTKGWA